MNVIFHPTRNLHSWEKRLLQKGLGAVCCFLSCLWKSCIVCILISHPSKVLFHPGMGSHPSCVKSEFQHHPGLRAGAAGAAAGKCRLSSLWFWLGFPLVITIQSEVATSLNRNFQVPLEKSRGCF